MYVRRRAYLHHGREGAHPCSLAGDLLRHRRREHLAEHLSVGGWVRKQRLNSQLRVGEEQHKLKPEAHLAVYLPPSTWRPSLRLTP